MTAAIALRIDGMTCDSCATHVRDALERVPGVRSVAEQGIPGFEITGWNVLYAPKGTPPEVLKRLAAEVEKVMALPETRQKLLQLGIEPKTATGAELDRFDRFDAVIE